VKTLTLLRHAKSSWDDPGLADHDRPLNRRGQNDAPVMGERIRAAGIRPSLILSSTAIRAWETARIVARELGYPAEFLQRDSNLYLADLNTLIDVIDEQETGFNNIMVVAHNPGLTDLANYLVPGLTNNVPTCGVVSVSLDSDTWDIRGPQNIELLYYDYPKKAQ